MHIFPFSPRPGTPAAQMPNQVPSHLLQRRKEQLANLDRTLRRRYLESLIGRKLEVLAEKTEEGLPGHLSGTACRGVRVIFPGKSEWLGQILPVRAVAIWGKSLVGYAELVSEQQFQDTPQIFRFGSATNTSVQNLAKKFSLPVVVGNF
jgi:threonylcarbamoyladenosine tRNA methylthiotransferase MtaB